MVDNHEKRLSNMMAIIQPLISLKKNVFSKTNPSERLVLCGLPFSPFFFWVGFIPFYGGRPPANRQLQRRVPSFDPFIGDFPMESPLTCLITIG
jgi:hypothetical protein